MWMLSTEPLETHIFYSDAFNIKKKMNGFFCCFCAGGKLGFGSKSDSFNQSKSILVFDLGRYQPKEKGGNSL